MGIFPCLFLKVLSAPLQQKVDDLHVAAHGGPVQRGVIPDVERVDVGALLHQELHRVQMAAARPPRGSRASGRLAARPRPRR